jgi:hypothetical protein
MALLFLIVIGVIAIVIVKVRQVYFLNYGSIQQNPLLLLSFKVSVRVQKHLAYLWHKLLDK